MTKVVTSILVVIVIGLPIWGIYNGYLYIQNLPNQWHQEKVSRAVRSAITGLRYIQAGEKDIGCIKLRFAHLRLIELNANSAANDVKEGYNKVCR